MFTGLFAGFEASLLAEAAKVGAETLALFGKEGATAVADIKDVIAVGTPLAVSEVGAQARQVYSGKLKFSTAVVNVWQALEEKLGPVARQDVQSLVQNTFNGMEQIAKGAYGDLTGTTPAAPAPTA